MSSRGSAVARVAYQEGRRRTGALAPHGEHERFDRRAPQVAVPRPGAVDGGDDASPRAGADQAPAGQATDDAPWRWRFALPTDDASVPHARYAVRDLLLRQQPPVRPELVHTLLLIVSELVTNAVRHAVLLTTEVGLEVELEPDRLQLAVEDGHPYRPDALAAAPGHEHLGGRGLLLVRHLVAEEGGGYQVERTAAGGKVVRVTLPLPAGG